VSSSPVCTCLSCPTHPNETTTGPNRPAGCGFYPFSTMSDTQSWVPQLLPNESARMGGLSWGNGCRPGDMSCH